MASNFLKYPESTLGRMFSEEYIHLNPPDDKGEYFIGWVGLSIVHHLSHQWYLLQIEMADCLNIY